MILDNVEIDAIRVVRAEHVHLAAPLGSVAQLIHASIDQGIAQAAHRATMDYVRTRTRPWRNTGLDHGYEDPYIIAGIGEHETRLHAAEAMLLRGAQFLETVFDTLSEDNSAAAAIAIAEAKILTTEISLQVTSSCFSMPVRDPPAANLPSIATFVTPVCTRHTTRCTGNST